MTFFTLVFFRFAQEATPLQYKFSNSYRVVYFQQGLKKSENKWWTERQDKEQTFKLNFFYSQKIKINCTIIIWILFVTCHLKGLCHGWIVHSVLFYRCQLHVRISCYETWETTFEWQNHKHFIKLCKHSSSSWSIRASFRICCGIYTFFQRSGPGSSKGG